MKINNMAHRLTIYTRSSQEGRGVFHNPCSYYVYILAGHLSNPKTAADMFPLAFVIRLHESDAVR